MTHTERTPYCHKIRYGITGAPILTEDEMDGGHAPGIGVSPELIELVYSAARDGKPASVSASVTGSWTRFGERADGQVAVHFKNGPDGWPAWLAEEARLHDPDAPAVPAGQAPATDQTALRDRIAEALLDHLSRTADIRHDTDGELAFMPVVTDEERMRIAAALAAVLPASVDRAAVLREAADELDAHAAQLADVSDDPAVFVAKARSRAATEWRVAAALVRRMAAAAPSAVVVRRATDETPGEADVPPAAIRAAALREAVAELKRDAFGPIARLLRMADEAEHPETACICTEDAWPPHCPCRADEQPAVGAQQPKEA